VAALLKEAFCGLAVKMNNGFSGLGVSLKVKNDAKGDGNGPALSDPESGENWGGSDKEPEEPARKKKQNKKKTKKQADDGVVLSKDNSYLINSKRNLMSLNKMALKFMET